MFLKLNWGSEPLQHGRYAVICNEGIVMKLSYWWKETFSILLGAVSIIAVHKLGVETEINWSWKQMAAAIFLIFIF